MLQYYIDNALILFSSALVRLINLLYFRFRIRDIQSLRAQFKAIVNDTPGALLICPNHLTYLDSIIIQFALASPWYYMTHPRMYAWNLPKKANVKASHFFSFMCYLGKCILLPKREEPAAVKTTMQKIHWLLKKKEYVLLFPEGTRSLSGRINDQNFTYGAGELLHAAPGTKVLCVYLRGDHQIEKSKFPIRGETFSISLKLIEPKTEETGLRAGRDLSRKIIKHLIEMEQDYFIHRK